MEPDFCCADQFHALVAHLSSALNNAETLHARARTILEYLKDPQPAEEARPIQFILEMQQVRPYRVWCREVENVTREVFWIFIHNLNVVSLPPKETSIDWAGLDGKSESSPAGFMSSASTRPASTSSAKEITSAGAVPGTSHSSETTRPSSPPSSCSSYTKTHFPAPHPPVPAAPHVGGVEWDATNYLSAHLDLMNGLLAALPTPQERNTVRAQLRISGFETVMGESLRICSEKFYASIHTGLRGWVAAAVADQWDYALVRNGPRDNSAAANHPPQLVGGPRSPAKKKKKGNATPQLLELDTPVFDLGLDLCIDATDAF